MKSRLIAVVIHRRVIYGSLQLSRFGADHLPARPYGDALFIVARTARYGADCEHASIFSAARSPSI